MSEQLSLDGVLNMLWIAFIAIFFIYGQKIQLAITLRRLGGMLSKLKVMKDEARIKLVETLSKFNPDKKSVETNVDRLLESFVISPVNLDPKGIIWKMEHLLDAYEDTIKQDVAKLSRSPAEDKVNTLSNLLELSLALNMMYRIARHFYLTGKKQGNVFAVIQLQVAFPMIMDAAEAYHSGLPAFAEGLTIGDGLGPLVASRLLSGQSVSEIAKDTVVGEQAVDGRKVLVVKAKGPGGNVGKPGEAVKKLVDSDNNISLIVTIDAALMFEGEESGEVAEGIGAAIGGPGVERYKIEEVATNHGIPTAAIVVKMSQKDAISEIKPRVRESVESIIERLKRIIVSNTKKGDHIVVAGIGNTLGIR